jgi:L-ribulose-5-phosphate 4-epimerase
MENETGSIKFECTWQKTAPFDIQQFDKLNYCRTRLHQLGFIGVYPDNIGYGNISIRLVNNEFLVTGTASGHIAILTNEHYTKVTKYNFIQNRLTCKGPIKASSESLTHAAIYACDREINAVIHIHSKLLWDSLLHKIPTTSEDVEYGTPEMAMEIFRLFREPEIKVTKIFAMAGHPEGIISFGKTIDEAMDLILKITDGNRIKF